METDTEVKQLQTKLDKLGTDLDAWMKKHGEEVKTLGTASEETKKTLEKLGTDWKETSARLLAIEQKLTAPGGGGQDLPKSVGELFIQSEGFKAVQNGANRSGQVKIGALHKTAIVNATGQNQPLVPDQRVAGIITPGLRRLTVRDLLPSQRTSSNLVQFVKELLFTNNAAMQTGGSPNSGENVAKAESALTFELANSPVQTLAHWIPASRQILSDAPSLKDYINNRLLYGLKLAEEDQLLNGSGSGNNLSGLITEATTMSTTGAVTASDTYIDTLRRAMTQVSDSEFEADGIVLNPHDWETIQLTKETGSGISSGAYIFSNPHTAEENRIWGLPVVPTRSIAQGQFLVGAFRLAAGIWDREDATVEVSREHSDFFVKNMVAILCEERLALTVYRPLALIYGGFPFGS